MTLPEPVLRDRPTSGPLVDRYARAHTYLRVSVTDRCNYRCVYCLPVEGVTWLPRDHLLSYEEIARLVRVFANMGVTGVRLTGGEPTVRRDLVRLVAAIAAIDGIADIALTTNGHLFAKHAAALAEAGLSRVNVSLDTLDPDRFAAITRGGSLDRVLASVGAALELGLTPVKINCVVVRGDNEDDVPRIVEHFAAWPDRVIVRFIEKMPFRNEPRRCVPSRELRERLARRYTLKPAPRVAGAGPAANWRIVETGQIVGFISPITEHFCQACNRLRLQANGDLRTCLSRDDTPNLRAVMRSGIGDADLEALVREMVWGKVAGHEAHLERWTGFEGVMTTIGG